MGGLANLLLSSISRLVMLLSERATRRLARGLAWLIFGLFGYRRAVIAQNLEASFPELGLAERRMLSRQVGQHLVLTFLEFLRIPRYAARNFDNVECLGLEHYEAAFAKGKGVLCLAGHLGSFEMTAAAVARLLRPNKSWLIVKPLPGGVDRFVVSVRRRGGTDVIPAKGALKSVFLALKRQELVAFVLDQHAPGDTGVPVQFFGRAAQGLVALAVVAERTGAPVIAASAHRRPDGTHLLVLHPEIPFEAQADRAQTLQQMTQVYTRVIERAIRAHPEQWFWSHRRWKPALRPSKPA